MALCAGGISDRSAPGGSAGFPAGPPVAGGVFSGKEPGAGAASPPGGFGVSEAGVGGAAGDSLWTDYRLWGHRPDAGGENRTPPVRSGGRRRGCPESHCHPDPLPSGGGDRGQPHRLRRRAGRQNCPAGAGGPGYETVLASHPGDGPVKRKSSAKRGGPVKTGPPRSLPKASQSFTSADVKAMESVFCRDLCAAENTLGGTGVELSAARGQPGRRRKPSRKAASPLFQRSSGFTSGKSPS